MTAASLNLCSTNTNSVKPLNISGTSKGRLAGYLSTSIFKYGALFLVQIFRLQRDQQTNNTSRADRVIRFCLSFLILISDYFHFHFHSSPSTKFHHRLQDDRLHGIDPPASSVSPPSVWRHKQHHLQHHRTYQHGRQVSVCSRQQRKQSSESQANSLMLPHYPWRLPLRSCHYRASTISCSLL